MENNSNICFTDKEITFANGIQGIPITIPTANPENFYQAISKNQEMSPIQIHGKLFLPTTNSQNPIVIIVPGSLGVAPSHLAHAETLTDLGIAACVIDPFDARDITSTVANQTQYSFAASAWDVLATAQFLDQREDIDSQRIGSQGHSRGGSAVMTAASKRFASASKAPALAAIYAAYPWCGQQFLDPDVGSTVVRAVIGDRDEWCLPQQVQGHIQAIRVRGGNASLRIFPEAHHSFDRNTPVELIAEASVSPGAPTCYIDNDGAFIHPLLDTPDSKLVDRDLMVYGMKAGYGRKGARIGSQGDQADQFNTDMISFWKANFLT